MAVLVEDLTAGIGGANVETNTGTTKSGLPWAVEVVSAEVTDEKPTPEAARTEAWASSWPEDKDKPGTPPSAAGRLWQARGKTICRRLGQIRSLQSLGR